MLESTRRDLVAIVDIAALAAMKLKSDEPLRQTLERIERIAKEALVAERTHEKALLLAVSITESEA